MIRRLNLFQRLQILTMVPKGSHIEDAKVDYFQTDHIRVDFGEKVPYHVDGELHFDTKFAVAVIPSALRIIFDPDGPHYFG
jgi:diacylglycerol kinase family enzyme